jgi:hypothetical protein
MAVSFVKSWTKLLPPGEPVNPLLPTLDVLLVGVGGRSQREIFIVDSGADISLAPRHLCDELGLPYDAGTAIQLQGISPKPECTVPARILEVELIVPDAGLGVTIPICFAEGDASQLLGREGFFDCFRVEFDKSQLLTKFELVEGLGGWGQGREA